MAKAAAKPASTREGERLTARQVETIKRPGIYADGDGLSLVVTDAGTKAWRYRFRLAGKGGIFTIGQYPDVSLAKARAALEDAKADVRAGRSPVQARQAARWTTEREQAKARDTLGAVTERWYTAAAREPDVWSESHASKTRGRIDNHLATTGLWAMPIRDVRTADLAALLDRLHATAPDTCSKVRQILSGVFRFAAARDLVDADPVAATRPGSGQRKKSAGKKNLPATTDLATLGRILRSIDLAQASWQVKAALTLMAYTAQRPGRVVAARWSEFDLDGESPCWTIARQDQKNKSAERGDHVVPLAPLVVDWLRTLPRDGDFLFRTPGTDKGHVTLEAPSKLLRKSLGLSGQHTPHGFRSTFSTLANAANNADESRRFDRDDIEHVLDHEIPSETVRAYDRKRALPRLRHIMLWWADTVRKAKESA